MTATNALSEINDIQVTRQTWEARHNEAEQNLAWFQENESQAREEYEAPGNDWSTYYPARVDLDGKNLTKAWDIAKERLRGAQDEVSQIARQWAEWEKQARLREIELRPEAAKQQREVEKAKIRRELMEEREREKLREEVRRELEKEERSKK